MTSGSDDIDKVGLASAIRPRLSPLRVHEGGVHAPVQELLAKQDAVGELRSGSTQPRCLDTQMATVVQYVPSFFMNHQCFSSFMLKKIPEINLPGDNLVQLPGFLRSC